MTFVISSSLINISLQSYFGVLRIGNILSPEYRADEELNYNAKTIPIMLSTIITTGIPVTLISSILSNNIVTSRLIILLYASILIYITYLISKHISGNKWKLSVLFIGTSITILTYSFWFVGEVPATAFMLISIFFMLKNNSEGLLLAGVFAALAVLTKQQMLMFLVGIYIYAYIFNIKIRYISFGIILILVPYNVLKLYYIGTDGYISDLNLIFNVISSNDTNSYAIRSISNYVFNGGRLFLDNISLIMLLCIYITKDSIIRLYFYKQTRLILFFCIIQILVFLIMPYGDRYGLAIVPLLSILVADMLPLKVERIG